MKWRAAIFSVLALFIGGGLIWYTASFQYSRQILTSQEAAVSEVLSAETREAAAPPQEEEKTALVEPVKEFATRITKKPFGIYITPETSPVQPDRFTGYHTGVDVEYEDVPGNVPVRAIADGTVVESRFASGYGGVLVVRHRIDGRNILALYGHLNPADLPLKNTTVQKGETVGMLGEGGTEETDGARKHLHFALLKNDVVDIRGYVQTPEELTGWYNPQDFFARN